VNVSYVGNAETCVLKKLFDELFNLTVLDFDRLNPTDKDACTQRAVWRQAGYWLVDSLVGILKFTARRNLSEPPPERQAAGRCASAGDSAAGQ